VRYTILIDPQIIFNIKKINKYYLWTYHNCAHQQVYIPIHIKEIVYGRIHLNVFL
jgi:hypothetical protein